MWRLLTQTTHGPGLLVYMKTRGKTGLLSGRLSEKMEGRFRK